MRRLIAMALFVGACTSGGAGTTTSASSTILEDETTTTIPRDAPPCLTGTRPFSQEGGAGVLTRPAGDSVTIGLVTWQRFEGCEQLKIAFTTEDGAPAVDPPTVAPLFIRSSGVLRLTLGSEMSASSFLDQTVGTDLIGRIFAVRNVGGGLFIDLHLAAPAFIRVSSASSPAEVTIDVRPGGPEYPAKPLQSGDVMVVEPLMGTTTYPFSVTGYVATGAVNVRASIAEAGIDVVGPAGEQFDTWGAFTVLFPDGPLGPITVSVADAVEISLTAE